MTLTVGSLFAGIGGFDLGLERAGMRVRWQVEKNEFCQSVLAKHWPNVTRHGDIKELDGSELERVDLICGGFPCQPISRAGKQQVTADERWLWPEFARIIRVVRPRFVVLENVPELLDPWRDRDGRWNAAPVEEVITDLEACGYHTEWDCLPACSFGAPHERDRVFMVAHTDSQRVRDESIAECWCERSSVFANNGASQRLAHADDDECQTASEADQTLGWLRAESARSGSDGSGREWWVSEPAVGRVADGIPYRLVRDSNFAYGNAVVPQVVEWVGRQLIAQLERVA